MKKVNLAVVGATGMVGRTFLKVLEERQLPIENFYVMASSRSAGSTLTFNGKDYIGMSNDSGINYDLNVLTPGNEVEITLFVYVNKNEEINTLTIDDEIIRIKKLNTENLENETIEYWTNFLKEHDIFNIFSNTFEHFFSC